MPESIFDVVGPRDSSWHESALPVPKTRPVTYKTMAGFGLLFAIVTCLVIFQPYCFQTYANFFTTTAMQKELPADLPQPISIIWSPTVFSTVNAFARFTLAAVLGLQIFLFGIFAYGLLRILNPTFRITTGVDWNSSILLKTYMHTAPVIKAFLIAVTAFLPGFFAWRIVLGLMGDTPFSMWIRVAFSGAAVWLLFSRDGIAGDYENGNYLMPEKRSELWQILFRGLLAGTALWGLIQFSPYADPEDWFAFYKTLGGFGENAWFSILWTIFALWSIAVFFLGTLLTALGHPELNIKRRLTFGVPMAVLYICALYYTHVAVPNSLKNRYDFVPNFTVFPVERLAKKLGVKMEASGKDTILLLRNGRAFPFNMLHQSFIGIDASPETGKKVEDFLQKREYKTSLQEQAFYTLHDVANLSWNPNASLKVDFDNLNKVQDPQYVNVFIDKLRCSAATPENHKVLDDFANSPNFAFSDRQAIELIGDLYARFGDSKNASVWYRKARIATTQIPSRLSDRLMFNNGEISGRLLLDGKPVSGAKIGVMPIEVARSVPYNMLPNGTVRPFWLRWLSAAGKTGANGEFKFDHLVAETYRLVVSIPGTTPESFAPVSKFENWSGRGIFVGFAKPKNDVGKVEIYSSMPAGSQFSPDDEPPRPDVSAPKPKMAPTAPE